MNALRLLIDAPAAGAWNMAVDEALLESAAECGMATLRFYRWEVPTLSLGYFQHAADRSQHAASLHCPLVRRSSGGGAILHDRELTYSIALPLEHSAKHAATHLYDACHETLVAVLADCGVNATIFPQGGPGCAAIPEPAAGDKWTGQPFLCFQRHSCGDILLGDAKVVGSAQRRRRGAVLQHGSILIARSPYAPELSGIQELAAVAVLADLLIDRWTGPLSQRLKRSPAPGRMTPAETEAATRIAKSRFGIAEFTHRR